MSTTHPRRRVAAAGSSGEMPQKARAKAVTASSRGDPQTHRAKEKVLPSRPRCDSPGTQEARNSTEIGAAGEHKQSKGGASPSRNIPLSRFLLARRQRRASPFSPFSSLTNVVDVIGIHAGASSSLDSHHGDATALDLQGSSVQHRSKERAGTGSSGRMAHNPCTKDKPGTALKSGTPQKHSSRVNADTASSVEMLHKHRDGGMLRKHSGTQLQLRRNSLGIQGASTLAVPRVAGKKKHIKSNTFSTRGDSQHTIQQFNTATSPDVSTTIKDSGTQLQLRRNSLGIQGGNTLTVPRVAGKKRHTEGNTFSTRGDSQHTSQQPTSLDVNTTIKDGNEESAANDTGRHTEEDLHELHLLIQSLNKLGLGEDADDGDFVGVCALLPHPPKIDRFVELKGRKLNALYVRLALHRIKYYKFSQVSKNIKCVGENGSTLDHAYLQYDEDNEELSLLEREDLSPAFLEDEGFFERFEQDGKLDWSFHPDHVRIAALDDYQRIVPRNHGGYEYANWKKYRSYLNSYEIEHEYLEYCEQLSKQLKWMEDYILLPRLQWGSVCSRGALQALKIATSFSKITVSLAYTAYYDCIDSMRFNVFWHKELDGIYFEIWRRVNQGMSFTEALREVYNLKRFPLREKRMKSELEKGYSKMENEFLTCTAGITKVVTDDEARELIAAGLQKMRRKSKGYEDYIRKKIYIAQAIGVIHTDSSK